MIARPAPTPLEQTDTPTSASAPALGDYLTLLPPPAGKSGKEPPFTQIPKALLTDERLPPLARFLYGMIASHVNHETKECFPSVKCLVRESGMSKSSVLRCIGLLESAGWLLVTRVKDETGRNHVNHYRPLLIPQSTSESGGVVSHRHQGVVSEGHPNKINSFN